jgi:predicted transcriptional regulator of viral defense system
VENDISIEQCHFPRENQSMSPKQEAKLRQLGVFTLIQAEELGIGQQALSKLVKMERLKRVGRGIYLHPQANIDQSVGFQIACAKFGPESAIGGLSALFHYNLAEQVPGQTWVLVPPEKRSSEQGYRLIRTKAPLDRGIVAKDGYKIVSIERAILEGLKLATKIGERTAIAAARTAIAKRQTSESKLGKAAKDLGLESVIARYFEAIVA